MTNLIASVIVTLSTNWVTVSKTSPVCGMVGCAVFHGSSVHQIGTRQTNTVARVQWKGEDREVILETSPGPQCGERDVADNPLQSLNLFN